MALVVTAGVAAAVGVGVAMMIGAEASGVDNLTGCALSFSVVRGAELAVEAVAPRVATADRLAEATAVLASSPASHCCGAIVVVVGVVTASLEAIVVVLEPRCPVAVSLAIVGAAAGLAKAATGAAEATAATRLFMVVVMTAEVLLGVAAAAAVVVEATGIYTLSG